MIYPLKFNPSIIVHNEKVRFWPGISRLSGLVQSRLHYDSLWWGYYLQWSNFSSCENGSWKLEKRKEESRKNFVYPGIPNSSPEICSRILSIPTWTHLSARLMSICNLCMRTENWMVSIWNKPHIGPFAWTAWSNSWLYWVVLVKLPPYLLWEDLLQWPLDRFCHNLCHVKVSHHFSYHMACNCPSALSHKNYHVLPFLIPFQMQDRGTMFP